MKNIKQQMTQTGVFLSQALWPVRKKVNRDRSKYMPHQGAREIARRQRQAAKAAQKIEKRA